MSRTSFREHSQSWNTREIPSTTLSGSRPFRSMWQLTRRESAMSRQLSVQPEESYIKTTTAEFIQSTYKKLILENGFINSVIQTDGVLQAVC
eukprot:2700047-Amphidinium_carterae.7